jgi:hypothetical protein
MKIQIIRGTVANGGPVRVGQIISVDPKEASQLIGTARKPKAK